MNNRIKISVVLIVTVFILTNCNNNTQKQTKTDVFKNTSVKSELEEAKSIAKTILEYVEQADCKEITKNELDIKAKPLQNKLDSLRLILTADEINDLDSYRSKLFSKMIDRKVERDRK